MANGLRDAMRKARARHSLELISPSALMCLRFFCTPIIRWIEVDPETLCQFTGLCDKNGKKILENDILKTRDDQYAQVKFGFYGTAFARGDYNQGFYAAFPEDSYYRHELGFWCKKTYVGGNIFDNKELLQEEH